ncbi:MAG: SDR family oxidoreductase [Henriciella sp.]
MTDEILLLTGANGRTGRAILKAMASRGLRVRAFVRDATQSKELKALGADEIAVGDFIDVASISAAVEGVAKILHIGPPMHVNEVEISARFLAAAKTHSVSHFIYYSVMHPILRDIRHHALKLEVEEKVVGSGLPYTIVQPSRYMQHLLPIWPHIVNEGVHAMPFSIKQHFSLVDLRDLAEACAIIAAEETHYYATYELAGPAALNQRDMAKIISEIIGKPVKAEAMSLEAMTEKARAAGASDDRVAQMCAMNGHYDAHGFRGNPNVLEFILGRAPTPFENYVKELAGV